MKQKTEIEYIKKDDYYIPNLTLKKKNRKVNLGKFALLRLNYLKEHKKALYQSSNERYVNRRTIRSGFKITSNVRKNN